MADDGFSPKSSLLTNIKLSSCNILNANIERYLLSLMSVGSFGGCAVVGMSSQ